MAGGDARHSLRRILVPCGVGIERGLHGAYCARAAESLGITSPLRHRATTDASHGLSLYLAALKCNS